MQRGATLAMATFTAIIVSMPVAAPVVSADPAVAPQAGAPCDAADPNAQTFAKPRSGMSEPEVLMCVGFQGRRWQSIGGLQRPVHDFYTYGPTETLYPADLHLGDFWDGVGSTTDAICVEEQTFSNGRPPETRSNNAGQYFGFTVSPDMVSVSLKGNCRWLISPCNGKKGPCTAGYASSAVAHRTRNS